MHETPETAATRNARLVIFSSFLSDLTFILPIWLLYSLDILRLKPTLAIAIFMSIWIGSALLEIPTGALADRLGRRKIFIIGQLLFALYPLAYAFKFPVPLLLATCLISAVGSSMRSGALLPIVHAAYNKANLGEKQYNKFLSTNQMALFIARALTGVSGAWLYTQNPTWPFYAMFVATMLNFFLGFFIQDTEVTGKPATNTEHIRQTLGIMRQSGLIVALLLAYVAFNLTAETIWTGYQALFQADHRSAFVIGWLFSATAVCSTVGAYFVRHIITRLHSFRLMQLFGLSVLATAALLAQPSHTLRLAAILPLGFGFGTTSIIINSAVQKHIKNRHQATALSVCSFLQYGVYAIGSLAFGIFWQFFGETGTRIIVLTTSLAAMMYVAFYSLTHKSLRADVTKALPAEYGSRVIPSVVE